MKTLSDKIRPEWEEDEGGLNIEDVKEFIKDLKKRIAIAGDMCNPFIEIDKLAGDKLI